MKNKALFLDRDGVINVEKNYVFKIKDFEFTRGIIDLLADYQKKGFYLFIITNQAGIAKGYYTIDDFTILTEWMLKELELNGIFIRKVYFCPHHPEITGPCRCRKPEPGLILDAISEFNIDPEESVLIGDKESDILAGKRAKIGRNLYIHDLIL